MCKNIFERDFSIVKKHGREVTIFPENFRSLNILIKRLETNIKRYEDLPEIKTFKSNQQFCQNPKFYDHGLSPLPI